MEIVSISTYNVAKPSKMSVLLTFFFFFFVNTKSLDRKKAVNSDRTWLIVARQLFWEYIFSGKCSYLNYAILSSTLQEH